MSIKPIVKFVVFLTSLLKKSTNYLKMLYFYKILGLYGGGWGLFLVGNFFFGFGTLGLVLSCLGLGPTLVANIVVVLIFFFFISSMIDIELFVFALKDNGRLGTVRSLSVLWVCELDCR